MLMPAASDHATSTMYTGILAIIGRPNALRSDAMTSGNNVYPMMHTDWKNELPHMSVLDGVLCQGNRLTCCLQEA